MKTITLKVDTELKDLKPGDLVMTAELHKVKKVRDEGWIEVVPVLPKCTLDCCKRECKHRHIMHIGYGQQGVLKVIRRRK